MCEEESEDAEAVAKLLEINDSIHRTIERYKLMKAGDIAAASKIPKGTLGTTTGVGKNAANELSLIDFDPEASTSQPSNGDLLGSSGTTSAPTTVEDDLLGLSITDQPLGQLGSISLGAGPPSNFSQQAFPYTSPASAPPTAFAASNSFSQPTASPPPTSRANYDAFASLVSPQSSFRPAAPTPPPPSGRVSSPPSHPADPFAALVGASSRSNSRPSTPSQRANGTSAMTNSATLLDLAQPVTASHNTANTTSAAADDEWNFTSALPETTMPVTNTFQVHKSTVKIMFTAERVSGQDSICIIARFSNETSVPISGLHFQVAVQRSYSLQMKPQSGRDMGPNQSNAIQQDIIVNGVPTGSGSAVSMRYKISYLKGGQPQEEQGTVPALGIA